MIIPTVAGTATRVQRGEDMSLLLITVVTEGSIQLHPGVIVDTVLLHVPIHHHHVHQVPVTLLLLLHVHPVPGPLLLHVREAIQEAAIQEAAAEAEDTDNREQRTDYRLQITDIG